MAARPSLGRDDSYNRVTVSRDLKSQVMSMIADSSESLPLNKISEHEEDESSDGVKRDLAPPPTTNGTSSLATQEPLNASDMATPTPEKPNPLEQVPTVRVDSKKPGQGDENEELGVADMAMPSPMRSHEPSGPELGRLGDTISKMVSSSQADIANDKETVGTSASRATTISQTPSGSDAPKSRPGLDKRQSTMKRLSTAFKRSVSKNQ